MSSDCTYDCAVCANEFSDFYTLRKSPTLRQIIASSAGSMITVIFLNPISVIKVRIQTSDIKIPISSVVSSVFKSKGILGFWSGARVGLVLAIPNSIFYMLSYENIKSIFGNHLGSLGVVGGIAGGLARSATVTLFSPMEYIRIIQTGGSSKSASTIAREIFRAEGIRGFYRGWKSSLLRDAPFSSIYWFCFESLRKQYSLIFDKYMIARMSSSDINHGVTFFSGASAGVVAAVVTHPFDVLKTKQQLHNLNSGLATSTPRNLLQLLNAGGFTSLYRGLTMRLATVIPASGIMITVYEAIKNIEFD